MALGISFTTFDFLKHHLNVPSNSHAKRRPPPPPPASQLPPSPPDLAGDCIDPVTQEDPV